MRFITESELFGNTEQAGKVWVRFEKTIESKAKNFSQYWDGDLWNLSYLGYGNFIGRRISKPFIPMGTKINLTLLAPKKYEKLIKSLLYIVSQFGAIGGRNRRGWGNFYLNSLDGKDYWEACEVKKAYEDFVSELSEYVSKGNPLQVIKIYEKNYKTSNPLEVLNEIGENYKNFRNRYYPDYTQAKNFLQNKHKFATVIYNRAWFGLPIIARYKSLSGKSVTINVFVFDNSQQKKQKRLASPVVFRVFRNKNRLFGVLFIVLYRPKFFARRGKFYKWSLGENREVKIKGKNEKPVVMNQKFENFVCEFLTAMHTSTQPTLTLP